LEDDSGVEISDEALCQRVATRDEAAFDLLVGRYQERAYRLAWTILRDAEEARDLSQEAFIRLFQTASRFDGRSRFSTWFYRILVNLCLDHRRKYQWWRRVLTRARPGEEPDDSIIERQPTPSQDPVDEIGKEQAMKQLWAAVERLSAQQRAAVLLQVQEGLLTGEIAAVLKCSEATVRVHLHRALTALRKTMRKG
jgi:RNA polymerase sigma-70 factor (ECF subfamily)